MENYNQLNIMTINIVFIHEFLVPYCERVSLRASEWYGIKNDINKNDIRLLTCNNLFITYYMLKKIKPSS